VVPRRRGAREPSFDIFLQEPNSKAPPKKKGKSSGVVARPRAAREASFWTHVFLVFKKKTQRAPAKEKIGGAGVIGISERRAHPPCSQADESWQN